MIRHRFAAIASVALLLTGAAACSSDDEDSAATSYDAVATAAAATSAAAETGGFGDAQNVAPGPDDAAKGGGQAPAVAASESAPAGAPPSTVVRGAVTGAREDIIKNAAVSIETEDVNKARNDAVSRAQAVDADISSELRAGVGETASATIIFRVLPADFDSLVTNLSALGTVVESKTTTEDVTGQVADIQGRIEAAQDSAEKIRALIARADKIADLVTLEREYQARDAEIQSMSSQLASLKDRAGRSTVTLSIGPVTERSKAVVQQAVEEEEVAGFMGGLRQGWDAFVGTTVVAATVVGALLPFAVVLAIGAVVWLAVRRRRPRKIAAPAEPATPYATTAP